MRKTILYIFIATLIILLLRCCYTNSVGETIPETPSSKEYVDSILLENSKRDIYIKELEGNVAELNDKIAIDSIEHVKELDRYDKMSREEKVAVIEGNVGSVVDHIVGDNKMVCLDSIQMDSVNRTFLKLESSQGKIISQWSIIIAQSKSIELYKEKDESYNAIIDTLIVENFNLKDENGKLRVVLKQSNKKIKRNRKIAIGAGILAAIEGVILYLSVNK